MEPRLGHFYIRSRVSGCVFHAELCRDLLKKLKKQEMVIRRFKFTGEWILFLLTFLLVCILGTFPKRGQVVFVHYTGKLFMISNLYFGQGLTKFMYFLIMRRLNEYCILFSAQGLWQMVKSLILPETVERSFVSNSERVKW
jgi:hypothetical protein